MKKRITKVVAFAAAVLMLLTLVPVAALPEVNWPALSSVFGGSSADDTTSAPATAPVEELTPTETEGYYKDEDGNVYVDVDGDGDAEILSGDTVSDEDLWDSVTLGKDSVSDETAYNATPDKATPNYESTASGVEKVPGYQNSAYEPTQTNKEDHPFLPGGDAHINLSSIYYGAPATPEYPLLKWSANTSVVNTTDGAFPDVDVLTKFWHETASGIYNEYERPATVSSADETGYVYSRYDAMQGKWGLTLDRYTKTITLGQNGDGSYVSNFATFNLSDTPYLYFSTEMTDAVEMAISLRITTPKIDANTPAQTLWVTITDDMDRPGINAETRQYSMIPNVTVVNARTQDNPMLTNNTYVTGSITGCIDLTYVLPMIYAHARNGMDFQVNAVRVDVRAAEGKEMEASRINYLYFGPNYGSIFTPQVNAGLVDAAGQAVDNRAINEGWENGSAVTIENSPEKGQVITVDMTDSANLYSVTKSDKGTYATVTIPVRKWFNVLSDARKLVMSVKVDKTVDGVNPTVSLWGNPKGGIGVDRHRQSSTDNRPLEGGIRLDNEGILGILGNGIYLMEPRATYNSSGIDRTLGNSTSYDGKESWYDVLRSPYMYNETVTAPRSEYGITTEMVGYCYIVSIRISAPVGTKLTITDMHCEGNSAGLNMQNEEGSTVIAYDGGSGIHPVVDTPSTHNDVSGDNYAESSSTVATALPAAYGPFLNSSQYVVYDLMNRSTKITTDGKAPDDSSMSYTNDKNYSLEKYQITADPHGALFRVTANSTGIKEGPSSSHTTWDNLSKNDVVMLYGRITYSGNDWGLLIYENNNGRFFSWVKMSDGTILKEKIALHNFGTYTSADNFMSNRAKLYTAIQDYFKDIWLFTDFDTNTKFSDSSMRGTRTVFGDNNGTTSYEMPSLMTSLDKYTYSSGGNWGTNQYSSINGSDGAWDENSGYLDWVYNNSGTTSMTQIFDEPIELKLGDIKKSPPVLYYDIDYRGGMYNEYHTVFSVVIWIEIWNGVYPYFLRPFTSNGENGLMLSHVTDNVVEVPSIYTDGKTYDKYNGYYSFSSMIDSNGDKVQNDDASIVGMSVCLWQGGRLKINRLEVLTEEIDYLDVIRVKDSVKPDASFEYDYTNNVNIYDGFNILNDAYYYNHRYEGSGKEIDFDTSTEAIDPREYGVRGWKASVKDTYLSNGGWRGSDQDHYKDTSIGGWGYHNNYEYRTALGHLRVWVAPGEVGEVKLISNRNWAKNQYRYLYYSYSMRDVDTDLAVDDGIDANGNTVANAGVEMVLKSQKKNETGYVEDVTISSGNAVTVNWRADGEKGHYRTNMQCNPSVTACVDLMNIDLTNLNEIHFLMNNPYSEEAEFYINYVYLSNEPPNDDLTKVHNTPEYQYYYMMDNSGDRYSARFPTVDNPSGAVKEDSQRVNPLKITRGEILSNGEFYNDSNGSLKTVYDGSTALSATKSGDAIWFYSKLDDGTTNSWKGTHDEILEYYQYKDANEDGDKTVYDMSWSFGHWRLTDAQLNNLYKDPVKGTQGTLLRRYATNDEVLLRTGIEPIKELTYYNADGGQFYYEATSDHIKDGVMLNENNYYITSTGVMSNYLRPVRNGNTSIVVKPVKAGYIFEGWYRINDKGEMIDEAGNKTTTPDMLATYHLNTLPGDDYFIAKWIDDTSMASNSYTVAFYNTQADAKSDYTNNKIGKTGSKAWFNRTASYTVSTNLDRFEVTVPNTTWLTDASGAKKEIRGWFIYDGATNQLGDKLIAPGSTIRVTKNVQLVPELKDVALDANQLPQTITVNKGVQLYLYNYMWSDLTTEQRKNFTQLGSYACTPIKSKAEGGTHGIVYTETSGGVRTYSNIPMNVVLVASVDNPVSNYGWIAADNSQATQSLNAKGTGLTGSVVSVDQHYKFSVFCSMTLNYVTVKIGTTTFGKDNQGAVASMMNSYVNSSSNTAREMIFVSQVSVPAGYTIDCAGTLYTKNDKIENLKAGKGLDENFRLAASEPEELKAIINTNQPAGLTADVRALKATKFNSSGQFYLMVTENKGNAVTYYARTYVIYHKGSDYYVAYSDVILYEALPAAAKSTEEEL